jgi:aspartate racemase
MQRVKTIGIIGGMGPEATNLLCQLITALTPANCDQQHIPVLTFNNSAIPNRGQAIFQAGASPLPELVRTARVLEAAGADFLLMPCITAHFYLEPLQAALSIPVVDMVQITIQFIAANYPTLKRIGVIGSTATLKCGLYDRFLHAAGCKSVLTTDALQATVMNAIFGEVGIKAGFIDGPREELLLAAQELVGNGAQAIIAGCTEVSLVLKDGDLSVPIIDSLKILAALAVELALTEAEDVAPQMASCLPSPHGVAE